MLVPINPDPIEQAINKAIDFLHESQLPYGEFKTYASPHETMGEGIFDSSPYITSFVLYSLSFWANPKITALTTKGINFLLSEMEGAGLWRYCSSRNEKNHLLFPPDVDDTCCIAFVLKQNQINFPSNINMLLANKANNGLLFTWFLPRSTLPSEILVEIKRIVKPETFLYMIFVNGADNICCVTNANTLLYLGENEHTQPIIDYLVQVGLTSQEHSCSLYLHNVFAIQYIISRAYFHSAPSLVKIKKPITDRILAQQTMLGDFGGDMNTTFAICTLLNFDYQGAALDKAIHYLLTSQQANGSWLQGSMFNDSVSYYGSEELTTALAVEALARYLKLHK